MKYATEMSLERYLDLVFQVQTSFAPWASKNKNTSSLESCSKQLSHSARKKQQRIYHLQTLKTKCKNHSKCKKKKKKEVKRASWKVEQNDKIAFWSTEWSMNEGNMPLKKLQTKQKLCRGQCVQKRMHNFFTPFFFHQHCTLLSSLPVGDSKAIEKHTATDAHTFCKQKHDFSLLDTLISAKAISTIQKSCTCKEVLMPKCAFLSLQDDFPRSIQSPCAQCFLKLPNGFAVM